MEPKTRGKAERDILREAKKVLAKGTSAVEVSALFFGPDGHLRKLWKTDADRKKVTASELYKWLQKLLAELRAREAADFDSDIASHSGRLTVMVPKSLHAALKREAAREGVSLSELIRLKLGVAYRDLAGLLAGRESTESGNMKVV